MGISNYYKPNVKGIVSSEVILPCTLYPNCAVRFLPFKNRKFVTKRNKVGQPISSSKIWEKF